MNKILVFCLDKILFGININQIKGLSKLGKTKKIPKSPGWIGGSVKYRNSTFPLVRFWNLLGLETPKKQVLLLPSTLDYCAFVISGVKGIYEFDMNKKSNKIYCLPYLNGFGIFKEKIVIEVQLDKILTEKQKKTVKELNKKNEKK